MAAETRPERIRFRTFSDGDYDAVCDFLIALNRDGRDHINWNWARFEWMYGHPEFDRSAVGTIGLWLEGERIVGAAIYDLYFGEAFCGVLPGYEALYPEILDYACSALRDENGLGIAVCEHDETALEAVRKAGFSPREQTETILRIELSGDLPVRLPAGLRFTELDPVEDAEALSWLFWQGFDHGTDRAEFARTEQTPPRQRKHFRPELSVAAADPTGEAVSCCCLWYQENTDYAYVEPVCTIPAWRGRGAAGAVLREALNRAYRLGAARAYVISDLEFYRKLGFERDRRFSFFWKA